MRTDRRIWSRFPLGWLLSFWLVGCTIVSGLAFELIRLHGPFPWLITALSLVLAFYKTSEVVDLRFPSLRALKPETGLYLALILLPTAAYLALTFGQEFPFSGDADHHLAVHLGAYAFWRPLLPLLAGLLILFPLAVCFGKVGWWSVLAWAALWISSCYTKAPWAFARYPGSSYLFGIPWQFFARKLGWHSPLDAVRLHNAFSICVWLCLLRPWVTKKFPDRIALAVGLIFFYQHDVLHYFTSAYLEPWATIFILTGVEYLVTAPAENKARACLLVGTAAVIKEQGILLLPFFAAAALLPPRLRIDREGIRRHRAVAGLAAIGLLPFLLYYEFRLQSKVPRVVAMTPLRDLLAIDRYSEFLRRSAYQFGIFGGAVLFLVAGALIYACRKKKELRWVAGCLLAGAVFESVFFFCDLNSSNWIGYPRFQLVPLAVLASLAASAAPLPRARKAMIALGLFQSLALIPFFSAALRPEPFRNYTEHYDSPIYLRIRAVIDKAGPALAVRKIQVWDRVATYSFRMLRPAYPDLARRYELLAASEPACACAQPDTAVLAPKLFFGNLSGGKAARDAEERRMRECETEMKKTCRSIVKDDYHGNVLALLGWGPH